MDEKFYDKIMKQIAPETVRLGMFRFGRKNTAEDAVEAAVAAMWYDSNGAFVLPFLGIRVGQKNFEQDEKIACCVAEAMLNTILNHKLMLCHSQEVSQHLLQYLVKRTLEKS